MRDRVYLELQAAPHGKPPQNGHPEEEEEEEEEVLLTAYNK
jgi:hypothetical protein